jgi:hypothetical protein
METLDQIGNKHLADKASFAHGYTKYYAELFDPLRGDPVELVEIGVQFGPSIRMWLEYFQNGTIYGIDVAYPESHLKDVVANPSFHFIMADQGNPRRMTELVKTLPPLDIVIDDGCHMASHMKVSFECLWPHVKSGGLYIIEDCFALWHSCGASVVDGPAWLGSFIADVNWRGKSFYGRPDPTPHPLVLTANEETIESVTFTKGLTILRKK